jgi:transposase
VRHLLAAYDLSRDRLYGHIKPRKRRGEFLVFLRYVRSLYPLEVRLGLVLDNYSPHLSTRDDPRIGQWAAANNVELAYTPTNASWLNRIEAQFQALRYFTLDGTDHASHTEQASMIRRYIAWRNRKPTTAGCAKSSTGQRLPDAPLAEQDDVGLFFRPRRPLTRVAAGPPPPRRARRACYRRTSRRSRPGGAAPTGWR